MYDDDMEEMYDNVRKPEFFRPKSEQWHMFILSTIIGLVFQLLLLAYFSGIITERLDDVKYRVNRLETQFDTFVRGQVK